MFDEFDDSDDQIKVDSDEESDVDAPKEMGIGKVSKMFTWVLLLPW